MQFALFTLLVAALGASTKQKVNPVEKVTSLLEKLQKEIEDEGQAEAAAYDKYACFCKEQASDKQYNIEKFKENEQVLDAKIEDKEARKSELDAAIVELIREIGELTDQNTEAAGVRDTENTAYTTRTENLASAISAMKRAIDSLQASKGDMKDSKANLLTTEVIRNSIALADSMHLEHSGDNLLKLLQGNPHASSYHSNEIIGTLESLLKNFKQKKIQVDNEERATMQAHEMAQGARNNQIKALEKAKSEKSQMSAQLDAELNEHGTERQQTIASHEAESAFLGDLTTKCEDKATHWDSRSETRGNELTAIATALELLKGDVKKMYGTNDLGLMAVKKTTPSKRTAVLVETEADAPSAPSAPVAAVQLGEDEDWEDSSVSFLQIRPTDKVAARKKLMELLSNKASQLKSSAISTLLLKMRESPSPFAKVKQMISDLITRLEDQAGDEADQKSWCDEQLTEQTEHRDAAQIAVERLNALHTEKTALVAQLSEQITTLGEQIAEASLALEKATKMREQDEKNNQATQDEAEAGETAVQGAIDVLEAFYQSSLLQVSQPAQEAGYERYRDAKAGNDGQTVDDMAPEEISSSSKTDASKSIISMLKQIQEDFANTITTTTEDETASAATYESFKTDTNEDIDGKTTLKGTKADEKTEAELAINDCEADQKTENELLANAKKELLNLQPTCVESGLSWKERKARREQEIDALKSALKIFQDTDFG